MKTAKKITATVAVAAVLLSVFSCQKSFYTNANQDPNNPSNVPSSVLLTGVEVSLGYAQGGASSQFTSMFTQQTIGFGRQAAAYYSYTFTPADPEYLWDLMYTNVMENDYTLLQQAKTQGQNEYYGIASIIMAYSLQVDVDYWGKMPYSQAFQGAANTQPTYDNDQTLYNTALQLLNTGIAALSNSNKGGVYPAGDDIIYNGNEVQWIQFANAIKARIFIHQCKHNNTAFEDSAINAVNNTNALSSGYVNAVVNFGAAANNNAPWFQFINQRPGYILFTGSTLIDSMQAMNDPRDSIYVSFAGSTLGNYYGGPTSPVEFITTEELDLIAAEANERLGNAVPAQTAYTAALNASMTKLGVPAAEATTYIAAQGTLPVSQASAIHQIGVQAWIALYLNPEAWAEWRRNNAPILKPIAGSEVIRRMIYPNSEVTLNPNTPTGVTVFVPQVFWDN